jgi:hypothetical protein
VQLPQNEHAPSRSHLPFCTSTSILTQHAGCRCFKNHGVPSRMTQKSVSEEPSLAPRRAENRRLRAQAPF